MESHAWGEVVDKSHALPGTEHLLKAMGTMHISRVKQIFKLFPDGTVNIEIQKKEPKAKEPTIIYPMPRNDDFTKAVKWVMTNTFIRAYDAQGKQVNEIAINFPLLTGLVSALKSGCDVDKRDLSLLPSITMNADATDILNGCVRDQFSKDSNATVFEREGLLFVKRKIGSLSFYSGAINKGILPIVQREYMRRQMSPYIQRAFYRPIRRQERAWRIISASYRMGVSDTADMSSGDEAATIPPDMPSTEEQDRILGQNMEQMDNLRKQMNLAECNTVTVIDPVEKKVVGSYVENKEGTSIYETSHYDVDEDNKQIQMMHHATYEIDVVTEASVVNHSNVTYENVSVLTP